MEKMVSFLSSSGVRRASNFHIGLKVKFDLRGQKLTKIVNLTREFDEDLVNIFQTIFELFQIFPKGFHYYSFCIDLNMAIYVAIITDIWVWFLALSLLFRQFL